MHRHHRAHRLLDLLVTTVVVVGTVVGGLVAASSAPASADPTPVASAVPGKTPGVLDGEVLAAAKVGTTMIVGGTFSTASSWGSTDVLSRRYLLAFDAATGVVSPTFVPQLNAEVQYLLPGPTAGTVIVAGDFTTVGGKGVSKVVTLDVATGALVSSFTAPAINSTVDTLARAGNRLYLGGTFTTVGGVAHVGIAALNATTGALDPYVNVQLSGHHNDSGKGVQAPIGVKALDVNPAGTRVIAIGNFKYADKILRNQIVMLDTSGATKASVLSTWATTRYAPYCNTNAFDSYMRDVKFSPDGSYFVVATTGSPFAGTLCDGAARWATAATGTDIAPSWVNMTGGDTLTAVEITDTTVYVGGHMRWLNNTNGKDTAGQGAVARPGIAALSPLTGLPLDWNPGRHPRGQAVWVLLATDDGLYAGTDQDYIGYFAYKRPRLAYFPFAGGHQVASDSQATLPADIVVAAPKTASYGNVLTRQSFNGTTIGTATTDSATGVDWGQVRGAFWAGDRVWYGYTDGSLYSRTLSKNTYGPAVKVDPYHDPSWAGKATGSGTSVYTGVSPSMFSSFKTAITGMAYTSNRLYWTQIGSKELYYRWFNADSGIVGSQVFVASNGMSWSDASLAFASGNQLYFVSRANGQLKKVTLTANLPTGTVTVVDAKRDWRGRAMFLAPQATNAKPTASFTSDCSELTCRFDASASADSDGYVTGYTWSFGDGTTATGTTTSHAYAASGARTVTLTATDNEGATSSSTATVTPTDPVVSSIAYVAGTSAALTAAATSVTVTVPTAVADGDAVLAYATWGDEGSASLSADLVAAGWTRLGAQSGSGTASAVWARKADYATSGSTFTVDLPASTKATLDLVAYRNAVLPTAAGVESSADSSAVAHTTPLVTAASGSWLVSYWSDKSSWTTGWATPASATSRVTAYGAGAARVTSVVADSGARVPAGRVGGLEARVDQQASTRAVMWSLALPPAS